MPPLPADTNIEDVDDGAMENVDVNTNNNTDYGEDTSGASHGMVHRQLPLLGQLGCAVIVLVAMISSVTKDGPNYGYGVAAAAVAMFFALIALVVSTRPDLASSLLFVAPLVGSVSVEFFFALFLFAWWSIAAGILTFNNPFVFTGNGYFATWGGFAFSVLGLGVSIDTIKSAASSVGSRIGLLAAAVVILCAIPPYIGKNESHNGESIYALVLSIVTIIVMLALLNLQGIDALAFPVLAVFAILWIAMAGVVTFRGPFLFTGNGYFAAWAGAACSFVAANAARTSGSSAGVQDTSGGGGDAGDSSNI